MSVRPSVRPSVRLFTFKVPFKRLFAPTSWSRMSKTFKDTESFGKSNKNRWFQIWQLLLIKGVKSPRKKKFVFGWFFLAKHGGNHPSWWIRDLWLKGVSLILAYLWIFFFKFSQFQLFFLFKIRWLFWYSLSNYSALWRFTKMKVWCCGCSCNDMWQVTCDRWHMACDTWHLTLDT